MIAHLIIIKTVLHNFVTYLKTLFKAVITSVILILTIKSYLNTIIVIVF